MTRGGRWLGIGAMVVGSLIAAPPAGSHVALEASLDTTQETPTPFLYTAGIDTAQETPTPFLYTATLDTAHEVPAPGVASTATGTAKFALNADKTLTYSVTVQNLTGAPVAAHVHQGAVGVAGPVITPLDPSAVTGTSGTFSGTTAALTDPQVTALQAGGLYVNVHTSANASGEIRGQIGAITAATGTAKFALNADKILRYSVTVQNLSGPPVAAHVHQGDPGVAGSVIVPLDASSLTGTGGTFSGTSTTVLTDAQVTALKAGGLYVNLHTALNGAGEVRGQITALPTPSATATFLLDQEAKTLQYAITATDLSGAVAAAHLHQAPPGTAGPVVVPLDTLLSGTTAPLDDTLITSLLDGGLYANVHTALNGGGEIRGQVHLKKDAATLCSCKDLTRKAFVACVKQEIKALDKEDKKSAAVKALKKAIPLSACGKKKGPKKAIACCLPQTPVENIVIGKLCAAISEKACGKKGGTSLGAGSSCFVSLFGNPNPNPCSPPASPSGAFVE